MPGWEMTVTTDTEALVRRAYHLAEGDVLDVQGFIDLFAEDGVFNGIGGVSGQESYRGEQLGDVVVWMGKLFPDVHRELHRVNVLGDVVAIEVSIRGTFLGPFETPTGVIQPTGAKLDIPTADFWYVRDGKVEVFDCHIAFTTLFAQLGILPDYASAVAVSAPER
jgi:ketosteroid isomerase-like protein